MRPQHPKLIEEIDVEIINKQPTNNELQEISAYIRADKAKTNRANHYIKESLDELRDRFCRSISD